MYGLSVDKINLFNEKEIDEVKEFLKQFNLGFDDNIDFTIVIREEKKIKATCSKAKNIFKCFAISEELRGEGISAKLVGALNDKLFEEGIYHNFIFTKPENIDIFLGLGYKLVYKIQNVALLENGIYDINKYIDNLVQKYNININSSKASLVMNCNPFTLGHKYIIEQASKQSDEVIVFIVEEDKSLFPFEDRYNMVKQGVAHLPNVIVVPGGEYIISSATFPSYFLRKEDVVLKAYTILDAGIFAEYFCRKLNIKKRFVGEEPYCRVTNEYNCSLKEILGSYDIEVIEIGRKKHEENAISASMVRQLIKENNISEVENIVPEVTWQFLNTDKGKEIMWKIENSNSPH